MIYDQIINTAPITQGDIFRDIPRLDIELFDTITTVENEARTTAEEGASFRKISWRDALEKAGRGGKLDVHATIKVVDAIVITQDCDAARNEYICLSQIDSFLEVIGLGEKDAPTTANKWQSLIIKKSREMPRVFYLPPVVPISPDRRLAADLSIIIRMRRKDLEALRASQRLYHLNDVALEHFRETLGNYFRRYAYNEWYPLNPDESEAYARNRQPEKVELYPWQRWETPTTPGDPPAS